MTKFLFSTFLLFSITSKAQKIDSIFVNLYTDSLKKGTYNYINIDGKLSNGRYIPLDSNQVKFTSDYGKFYGNDLFIDQSFDKPKVHIGIYLRNNQSIFKEFDVFIKTQEDPDLKTATEFEAEIIKKPKRKRKN